jgi:hypothetical protein
MQLRGPAALMSRKANCGDNAVTETLFGSRNVERLDDEKFNRCVRQKNR